jgi:uncharacterized protein (DUF1684 family)
MNIKFFQITANIFFFISCPSASIAQTCNDYVKEIGDWHIQRVGDSKKENGYLNLAGLFWLKKGKNTFGSDSSNDVIFPKDKIPGKCGYFLYEGNTVELVWRNPPFAFTPFSTYPLPPKQNILPLEIPAGENFDGENNAN